MGASPVAKEIKISVTADIKAMATEIQKMSAMFAAEMGRMKDESRKFGKQMTSAIQQMTSEMSGLNATFIRNNQQISKMRGEFKEAFAGMGQLLVENNAKVLKMVGNLAALHQQTRKIAGANKEVKENDPFNPGKLAATFAGMKLLNMAWNTLQAAVFKAKDELLEFDKQINQIASISGEKISHVSRDIFDLAIKSGRGINEIAKAIQDSSNEGNNLRDSFTKINAAILLSNKSMVPLSTSIARIDDIVDQFGVTAEKAAGTLLALNLSSERAQSVFSRMIKDSKEAEIGFERLSAIFSVLINKSGIAERTLQVGWRGVVNGLQDMSESSRKAFFDEIIPNWKKLNEEQRKYITTQLGIRQGDVIITEIADKWGEVLELEKKVNEEQEKMTANVMKDAPSMSKSFSNLWTTSLEQVYALGGALEKIFGVSSKIQRFVDTLVEGNRRTNANLAGFAHPDIENAAVKRIEEVEAKIRDLNEVYQFRNNVLQQSIRLGVQDVELAKSVNDLAKQLNSKKALLQSFYNNEEGSKKRLKEIDNESLSTLKSTVDFNIKKVKTIKQFDKEVEAWTKNQKELLESEVRATDLQDGKLASLKLQVKLTDKLLAAVIQKTNEVREEQKTEEFTIKLNEKQSQIYKDALQARQKLRDYENSQDKKDDNASGKKELERQKEILDIYQEQHTKILERRSAGEIGAIQETTQLRMIQGLLFGVADSKNQIAKSDLEITKINAQNTKEYEKQLQHMTELSAKDKERMQDAELKFERGMIKRQKGGRDLTDLENIKFQEKEVDLARARSEIKDTKARQDTIARAAQEIQRIEELQRNHYLHKNDAEQAQLAIDLQKVITDRDAKLAAFNVLFDAESDLIAKKQALYEKQHTSQKEMQTILAQNLQNTMGTVIDKLIFNTGTLSHIWKDLVKNIIADMAKKVVAQFVTNMLTGGTSGATGGLFGLLGLSTGTGMNGVPGYSIGTPMSGTDTVPAMLSPGEIVLDNNASDMFRGAMSGGGFGGKGGITIVIQNNPSLLGNREELIALDSAMSHPSVANVNKRRN